MQGYDAGVEEERQFEGRGGFDEAHGMGSAVGRFGAGFEGSAFEQAESVHTEFLEVFGQHELAWRVGAGEGFAVAAEDVDGFFRQCTAEILEGSLGHSCGSWEICQPMPEMFFSVGNGISPSFAIMLTTAS